MTVLLIDGVMKDDDPIDNAAPPEGAAYQSIVSPLPAAAKIVNTVVPHPASPVPAGSAGKVFTVAVTAGLVKDIQPVAIFLASV